MSTHILETSLNALHDSIDRQVPRLTHISTQSSDTNCSNVGDANAVRVLPILLKGMVATLWKGVTSSITNERSAKSIMWCILAWTAAALDILQNIFAWTIKWWIHGTIRMPRAVADCTPAVRTGRKRTIRYCIRVTTQQLTRSSYAYWVWHLQLTAIYTMKRRINAHTEANCRASADW